MNNHIPPLVSVLIPCYNVSAYVQKAVDSILSQSYANLEIWIIDDASTDDTLGKINAIKDNRVHVVSYKTNTQKVGAVNEVLQKVNGDYIAFQDADDWSEPDRIQEQVKQFIQNPALGICFTNFRYTGNRTFIPGRIALSNEELRDGFLEYDYKGALDFSLPICGTMMISRDALQTTGGYHPYFAGRVAEDIHWVYRILKNYEGVTVDKILYNYILRKGSLTEKQAAGKNAKYAYSWQLLSKIIYKDVHECIDVLSPANMEILKNLELDACEDALIESKQQLNETIEIYKNSWSFRIGRLILSPGRIIRLFKK